MKWHLMWAALNLLIKRIDADDIKKGLQLAWDNIEPILDGWLDILEDKHKDNEFVLYACKLVRDVGQIEDDDDEEIEKEFVDENA